MSNEIDFQKGLAQQRRAQEQITASTPLGRELIYCLRNALNCHQVLQNVRITKKSPLIMGTKEHVVKQM